VARGCGVEWREGVHRKWRRSAVTSIAPFSVFVGARWHWKSSQEHASFAGNSAASGGAWQALG